MPKIKVHKLSFIIVCAVTVILIALLGFYLINQFIYNQKQANYQQSLEPFYTPPANLDGAPGTLLKYEENTSISVPGGGTAYRILYLSQDPNAKNVAVSGMVFVPEVAAPAEGRKVIAWSHGTLGFGNECTPSRNEADPLRDMDYWLEGAMQRGYIVAATDYVGIGTPGTPYYLIGQSEANDVLNSIRAAKQIPNSSAGSDFVAWGHSQGGHAAFFTAQLAKNIAPELNLKGIAAAAPAAELGPLFSEQYNSTIAWGIGPDAAVSWPAVYPNLSLQSVLSKEALNNYERLAFGCVLQEALGIEIRGALNEKFFAQDPMQVSGWQEAAIEQTPDIGNIDVPIYVAQGLSDPLILPTITSLLTQKACDTGRLIELNWMGGVNHQLAAITAGPSVIAWIQDRFNDLPAASSCNQSLPVAPYSG